MNPILEDTLRTAVSTLRVSSSEEEDNHDSAMSHKHDNMSRRLSRAVQHPFKRLSKEELEVVHGNGERVVYTKHELVKMLQEKEDEKKKLGKSLLDIQNLFQSLSDSYTQVAGPCLCCAVKYLSAMVSECVETYESKVEGRDKNTDTDEKTSLVSASTLIRLKENARRLSIADHVIAEREKRLTEASVDILWRDIRSAQSDIGKITQDLDALKARMDRLRSGYKKVRYQWFFCRHKYYEVLIGEATIDCLLD